jgi:hypothetical protein
MASTNQGTYSFEAHATGTGSAPSGATDGQPLRDLAAVTVIVAADSGQTLSGAGTLQCYVYDAVTALWSRMPGADLSVGTASVRSLAFPALEVIGPRASRIKWVPASVTISSGSVTVHQLGHADAVRY